MRSAIVAISAFSHRHAWRATVGFLLAVLLCGGCADGTGPGPQPDPGGGSGSAIVSDPTTSAAAPTTASVAYVSLRPGSFPSGDRATVTNRRTGASLTVDLIAGGLDPVAIAGEIGDTLGFAIDTGGAQPLEFTQPVPLASPPTVVRTEPPVGKLNVPHDVQVRVIFSEPLSPTTVTHVTLGLTQPVSSANGSVALSTDGLIATFLPENLLLPQTKYTIQVRKGIRDTDGSHLEAMVTSGFTTGSTPPPPPPPPVASVTVTPGLATLARIGDTLHLAATLRDANGEVLLPRPTTWTSDDEAVATVDSTGLVRAVGDGLATVTATCEGVSGTAAITVVPVVSKELAFMSELGGAYDIYVMNADGSGVANLTSSPGWDHDPEWSPDGQQIAWSYSSPTGNADIYVMNGDGTARVRLTTTGHDIAPVWSPNGRKIAFNSGRDGNPDIYVMQGDGSAQTRLTTTTVDREHSPVWSPDGQKIAFTSTRDAQSGGYGNIAIYVMNADGSGATKLTNIPGWNTDPAWSPDGQKIAFSAGNDEIYVMNADGSGATNLTNRLGWDFGPVWSPDGQKIAFSGNGEIVVMNADGSAQTNLTNNTNNRFPDNSPRWSPDGQRIAFNSWPGGSSEIFVMNADGSGQTNLTNNAVDDFIAGWRP